jgi:hypothetical protein
MLFWSDCRVIRYVLSGSGCPLPITCNF